MISVISFDEPYGDNGRVGASSVTGIRSGLPYTAAVEEKINRLTPHFTAALSRLRVVMVLLR